MTVFEWIEDNISDQHLIRGILGATALFMLVTGVFQVGPPQWFGAPASDIEIAGQTAPDPVPDSAMTPGSDGTVETGAVSAITDTDDLLAGGSDKTGEPAQKADADTLSYGQSEAPAAPVIKDEKPAVKAQRPVQRKAQSDDTETALQLPDSEPSKPIIVARAFVKSIPDDQGTLTVKDQKAQFIAVVLPLILAANEEIMQRRSAIERQAQSDNREALERWARLYRLRDYPQSNAKLAQKILVRANAVPVPLALAQAAVESGWGTSRFARQGNALFGQWAWDESAGLRPLQASNSRAVVRSFPNLFGSVRAYMHNLNTHAQYEGFRQRRLKTRTSNPKRVANSLAEELDGYAETGYDYVVKLQLIMRSNDFYRYADAILR